MFEVKRPSPVQTANIITPWHQNYHTLLLQHRETSGRNKESAETNYVWRGQPCFQANDQSIHSVHDYFQDILWPPPPQVGARDRDRNEKRSLWLQQDATYQLITFNIWINQRQAVPPQSNTGYHEAKYTPLYVGTSTVDNNDTDWHQAHDIVCWNPHRWSSTCAS